MKNRKFLFPLFASMIIAAIIAISMPQTAYAVCGLPGYPKCPGGGKKKPGPTDVPPTLTPSPTECRLPSGAPCTPTPTACPLAPCTPTPVNTTTSGGCALAPCTPTPVSIPNTGGGGFSPLGMLLAGLIIVVCFGGIMIARNRLGLNTGGSGNDGEGGGSSDSGGDGGDGSQGGASDSGGDGGDGSQGGASDSGGDGGEGGMADGSNEFDKWSPNQNQSGPSGEPSNNTNDVNK